MAENGVKSEHPADSPTSVLEEEDCKEDTVIKSEVENDAESGASFHVSETMIKEEEKLQEERLIKDKKTTVKEEPHLNDTQFNKLDELLTQAATEDGGETVIAGKKKGRGSKRKAASSFNNCMFNNPTYDQQSTQHFNMTTVYNTSQPQQHIPSLSQPTQFPPELTALLNQMTPEQREILYSNHAFLDGMSRPVNESQLNRPPPTRPDSSAGSGAGRSRHSSGSRRESRQSTNAEPIGTGTGGPLTGPPPGMDEPTGYRMLGHPPGINVHPPRIEANDNMEIPIPGSTSTKAMHITEAVYKKERRVFIRRMPGKICFDPPVANTDISALLRHHFAGEGCWEETSMTTRDAVWYDFGMRYRWDEDDNIAVSRLFCQVAAKCYERMIYEARRRWANGGKKIGWMQEKHFRYLVKYRWDTAEFKKVSEKNRMNRGTDPTYHGGRKPMSAYQRELDDAAGIQKDVNEPTRTSLGVLIGSKKKGFKKHHEAVKDAIKKKSGRSGEQSSETDPVEGHEGLIQYQVGPTQLTLGEEMQYWSQPEGFMYTGQIEEYNRLMNEKYSDGRPDAGDPWMGVETAIWKAAGHNCGHGRIYGFGGSVNPRDFPGYSGSHSIYLGSQLRQTTAVEREHAAFVDQFSRRAPIDRHRDVDPHFDEHIRGAYHGESSRYETGGSSRRSDLEREDYDEEVDDDEEEV